MKNLFFFLLTVALFSCNRHAAHETGKWFSYSEDGEYQEFWIGTNGVALSYLSSIDKILMYEYTKGEKELNFNLIPNDLIKEHIFTLKINELSEDVMVTEFIGKNRTDPKKSYFKISDEVGDLPKDYYEAERFREEILQHKASGGKSHEGHNH
jgi:hypothetical protein